MTAVTNNTAVWVQVANSILAEMVSLFVAVEKPSGCFKFQVGV